jgi:dolichol-phosphate mannosyltransferase
MNVASRVSKKQPNAHSCVASLLVLVPTFNERENISSFLESIWASVPSANVLVVDDNSPDGTGALADELARESNGKLRVLHRRRKEGLGKAYIDGMKIALQEDYEFLVQMDADLSHDPQDLAAMLDAARDCDVVVGSRYRCGINVVNWDFKRLLLSKAATFYVNMLTGLRMTDTTSGFKCWRTRALGRLNLEKIMASGYLFQIEMNLLAIRAGLRMKESSIIFYERLRGSSKIDWRIIVGATFGTVVLALQHRFCGLRRVFGRV